VPAQTAGAGCPLARNPVLLGSSRAEEFSPVKNPTGVDSVETARRDLIRRAARWLEAAGIPVPRGGDGEPSACCEISPLAALDAAELAARAGAGGDLKLRPPRAGEAYYVAGPEGAGV
ncbi:MAG: hypothetical protein ACE5EX_00825, partial [Phycisphaerae bacterium]